MATERLTMPKTIEILRLKWELRLSNRAAALRVGVSAGTVANVVQRATRAGIRTYEQAKELAIGDTEGQRAYRMAQWDSLSMLAGCTTEGWVIQGGYCFPHPDKDNKVHGWRISAE